MCPSVQISNLIGDTCCVAAPLIVTPHSFPLGTPDLVGDFDVIAESSTSHLSTATVRLLALQGKMKGNIAYHNCDGC